MIDVRQVTGGYGTKTILHDVSFQVAEGEFFGILGPNGSGKTTLLNMMSGVLQMETGEVAMHGRPISAYSAKAFARQVAVLPQQTTQTFPYTVKETVALGRYAHQSGLFQTFTEQDEQVVQEVMQKTGVSVYQDKRLDRLSGGEKQRVYLAQALAQQPKILLLDEPTNHLDLAYQKELLDLLKQWTLTRELTVVSIFHDLNLASIYCDRLLLLNGGRTVICGHPDEVLSPTRIADVYQTKVEKHPHPQVAKPQIMLVPDTSLVQKNNAQIDESLLHVGQLFVELTAPFALKTMSSGVIGSGIGWHRRFMNRHVDKNYAIHDAEQDMASFLDEHGFSINETMAMMTAVHVTDVAYEFLTTSECSVLVVVTAGVGNAVDAVQGECHGFNTNASPGTINTWVFVNGVLSDTAFIQGLMTATEAKVKALHDAGVVDQVTGSLATGTSTDSTLIAGTQVGENLPYGGSITPLGGTVAKGVYRCTKQALLNSGERYDT